jgi:hypothetical protein
LTQVYHTDDDPEVDVDPEMLAIFLGIKELEESYHTGG